MVRSLDKNSVRPKDNRWKGWLDTTVDARDGYGFWSKQGNLIPTLRVCVCITNVLGPSVDFSQITHTTRRETPFDVSYTGRFNTLSTCFPLLFDVDCRTEWRPVYSHLPRRLHLVPHLRVRQACPVGDESRSGYNDTQSDVRISEVQKFSLVFLTTS